VPRLPALLPLAVACLPAFGCGDAHSRSTGAATAYRAPLTIHASLDRTATWVGDPVTYTVEVVCSPGYDIIEDDLTRDRLPVEGLEIRAADITRQARNDGTVLHRARFQLASYSPERESLHIGPMTIRYYQRPADGRNANRFPVGSVEVPAKDIALRSTLPESEGTAIRTNPSPMLLPRTLHLLYVLGLVLAALPLVTGIAVAIARRRASVQAPQGPTAPPPTDYRTALDEIRRVQDGGDPEAVRQAFGRLDHLLRKFLAAAGIDTASLTPDEIESQAGKAGDMTRQRAAAGVFRECERARYSGPNRPPSRDQLARALNETEALVSAGSEAR